MNIRKFLPLTALLFVVPRLFPQTISDSAYSPERLTRVDQFLQQYVDQKKIAGAVALVLHDGKPVYQKAVGWADKEANRPMTVSTLFRIASQTKALTSTAVLALAEEGKIGLTEPVSHFIPTFARTTVAVRSGDAVNTVPAKRAITIQDLLTHTAGISYGTEKQVAALYEAKGLGPAAGNGWYTADKDEPICETMTRLGALPSSPSLAKPSSMVTTRTSWDAWSKRPPACPSTSSSVPASPLPSA